MTMNRTRIGLGYEYVTQNIENTNSEKRIHRDIKHVKKNWEI